MNFIPTERLALDTNEYIFALRRDADHPACAALLFDRLPHLHLVLPLQVWRELTGQLSVKEQRFLINLLQDAASLERNFAPASVERIAFWQQRGAKKGDALIAAQLEAAGVSTLISENRHFLGEITDLPFEVVSAAELLRYLDEA